MMESRSVPLVRTPPSQPKTGPHDLYDGPLTAYGLYKQGPRQSGEEEEEEESLEPMDSLEPA